MKIFKSLKIVYCRYLANVIINDLASPNIISTLKIWCNYANYTKN